MNVDAIVADACALIETPSVNPFDEPPGAGTGEGEVARCYGEMLDAAGLEVRVDEVAPGRTNVAGVIRGSGEGPSIMLAGHLDTVGVDGYDDPFRATIEEGRLYGRGSCDMKAALAVFVDVTRRLRKEYGTLPGELILAGMADEEHLMLGSRGFSGLGLAPDFCVVGEPTDLAVCAAHKGQLGVRVKTEGRAVHSSIPEQGINAIVKMASVIQMFDNYARDLAQTEAHPLCGKPTCSVGVVRGGDLVSTVPDWCEIDVDRRLLPGDTPEAIIAEIRKRLEALVRDDESFTYEMAPTPFLHIPALDTPVDNPLVTAAVNAREVVLGRPSAAESFTGSTDAPHFACPAVILGPGNLAQAHSRNEFVEIADLEASAEMYFRIVGDLMGLNR